MGEEKKGSWLDSFVRGSEIFMHQTRMAAAAFGLTMLLGLLIGFSSAYLIYISWSDEQEQYYVWKNAVANIKDKLHMRKEDMEIVIDGKRYVATPKEIVEATEEVAAEGWRKVYNSALIGVLVSIATTLFTILFWWTYGRGKMTDEHLRGGSVVSGKELTEELHKRGEASDLTIAGVPYRKGAELLHTLLGGATGTGKSVAFSDLLSQFRQKKLRAIVYDPSGEYASRFYRAGRDVILNPLDARSPNWNFWQEVRKDYDYLNLAEGLIPKPPNNDPFFALAARILLEDTARTLAVKGMTTNRALYDAIALADLEKMHTMLQGTAGAKLVNPEVERTAMSINMTVINSLNSLRFLHDSGEQFSIRDWVEKKDDDSWLFITTKESQKNALCPIISLWVSIATRAVMDLPPSRQMRFWLLIDELAGLGKIDSLETALTNVRKYGVGIVIGLQQFSQLRQIYGAETAQTIISMCQTKLLLRVSDGDTAKDLSTLFGQAEIKEKEETTSYGITSQRDGVSVYERRRFEDIIMSSEITLLDDLEGYLKIPGKYPVAKVRYEWREYPEVAEPYIERNSISVPSARISLPEDLANEDYEVDLETGEILNAGAMSAGDSSAGEPGGENIMTPTNAGDSGSSSQSEPPEWFDNLSELPGGNHAGGNHA